MRDVLVAGIGSTPFGRHKEAEIQALAIRAADAAIRDSGLARSEVGALYLGNFVSGSLTGQEVLAGLVADGLGLPQIPCTKVEGACASGGIAFRHAYLAVASGQCDVALAVGVEKMTHADTAMTTAALNCAMDNRSDGVSGLTFPGLFGLAWHLHAERYGTTRAQVSAVIKKNKGERPEEPARADGCGDRGRSDHAVAADLRPRCGCSTAARRATGRRRCCWLRRSGEARWRAHPSPSWHPHRPAAAPALPDTRTCAASTPRSPLPGSPCSRPASGRTTSTSSNCTTASRSRRSSTRKTWASSRADRGAGYAAEGRTAVGGDRPVNPSGGLLSKGHPVGATGIGQIYETVLQLRGTHPNQVRNAAIGLTHNLGGTGVACTVSILRRVDA